MSSTIHSILNQAISQLSVESDSPVLDVELLLAHALGKPRIYLHTWPEREVPKDIQAQFETLLARRTMGEPIAYLLGTQEFWSLTLSVTPDTLIPRPETELLVEQALTHIADDDAAKLLDLGTGSGAIALAIAKERPRCQVLAADSSQKALAIASTNAKTLQLNNVEFILSNWFEAIPTQTFDLIVSNPPYIAQDDPHLKLGDVRFEPDTALVSGPDGLNDIRQLIQQAPAYLNKGGWLLLEHGYDQADAVCALLTAAGFVNICDYQDLGGQARVAVGQFQ